MKLYEITNKYIEAYHGSTKLFKSFDLSYSAKENDLHGPGIYFTTSKDEALHYGNFLITVKLKLQKVIKKNQKANIDIVKKMINMAPDKDDVLSDFAENPKIAFDNAVKQLFVENDAKETYERIAHTFYKDDNKLYCENMSSLGFDAVQVKTHIGYQYIVLNLKAIDIVSIKHLSDEQIENIEDKQ